MPIQIYNVLTRKKEEFVPINPNLVTLYVCGPTVYDHAHIGHAKTYVSFDVIVRYLRYSGYRVRYVQNITDVGHLLDTGEDRIMKGARREHVEPMELVETYTRSYFDDMDALGVLRPDISPRASAHIPEQIEMIKTLIEKGHAYEVNGSVYFSVPSFPDYGKLSNRRVNEEEQGARVTVREEKRHAADFALWKKAQDEHILKWPSPWSWGYPGWHVECSAMATKYLGGPFDIHGGGIDNIFPHNECEIAQYEAASDKQFANYWILTGSLTLDSVKMSKSLGNVLRIKDALKKYSMQALRFFILSSHYSNPVDFSDEALQAAAKGVDRLLAVVRATRDRLRTATEMNDSADFLNDLAEYRAGFTEAMDNNFNAPAALGVMSKLTTDVNTLFNSGKAINRATLEAIDKIYNDLAGSVLGLVPAELGTETSMDVVDGLVRMLIEMRTQARAEKNFARADSIRDQLAEIGVALEDGRDGTVWRLAK